MRLKVKSHHKNNHSHAQLNEEDSFKNSGILLDFSSGGGLIELKNSMISLGVGKRIAISFTLPNGTHIKELIVEVRNIRIEAGRKMVGLRFTDIDPVPNKVIEDFFTNYLNNSQIT